MEAQGLHVQQRCRTPPARSPAPRSPSSATPTSRSTRSAAPTSATSASSSATSRAPRWCCSSRTTARRRTSSRAANAVIGQQLRPQRQEAVDAPSATGEKIVGYTGYSGHDEAQFVADEIEALHSAGMAYRDMAVFYRTNAQTRALEEIFIRSAAALPGRRRHEVLRARRDQGRAGLPDRRREPGRRAGAAPHPEHPQARHRPGHRDAARAASPRPTASRFRAGACATPAALGLGPEGHRRRSCSWPRCSTRPPLMLDPANPAGAANVAEVLSFAARARAAARRAARQPRPAGRGARRERRRTRRRQTKEFDRNNPDGGLVDFLTEVSLVAAADDLDDAVGHRLADDPAHREGPRVRRGVPHRRRRGPAAAPDVGGRARRPGRGAPPVLRRHHPRPQAAVPVARDDPRAVRRDRTWRCRAATCRRSRPS